jgi:hypothetical protein
MSAVLAMEFDKGVLTKVNRLVELKQKGDVGDEIYFKCPQCKGNAGAVKCDDGVHTLCAHGCFEVTL